MEDNFNPTKKQVGEMADYFRTLYKKGYEKMDEAVLREVRDMLIQRSGIRLEHVQENPLLVYAIKDKAITGMCYRMRCNAEKVAEQARRVRAMLGLSLDGMTWKQFVLEEYWLLYDEALRRKTMKELLQKRMQLRKQGLLTFGIQIEINNAWKKIYDVVIEKKRDGVITFKELKQNPSLVTKMKNKAIVDMAFRLRNNKKDTIGPIYRTLIKEIENRKEVREIIGRRNVNRKIEQQEENEWRKLDSGHDEDDEDERRLRESNGVVEIRL